MVRQWFLDGAFSYKFDSNPNPQYEVFDQGRHAAKLHSIMPGVGNITFHPVHPYQPGVNDPNLRRRVNDAVIMNIPPNNRFRIYHTAPAQANLNQLNPIIMPANPHYSIQWIHDYIIYLDGERWLRLTQQHQSARSVYREPR